MKKEIQQWWSPVLDKDMEIAVYGYYGYALLLFPTSSSDYSEFERSSLIDSIADMIDSGTVKVFAINSVNKESWLNRNLLPEDKASRHQQYNHYIIDEVVPYINESCGGNIPIITSGASFGAFHAANTFFRRPDLFAGVIGMSGFYDLKIYAEKYFDDNVYFNSPVDYLANLTDESILSQMRNKNIIIASGQGENEDPEASKKLSHILNTKGIRNWLDIWGPDMVHDWSTWCRMLPYFLKNINV